MKLAAIAAMVAFVAAPALAQQYPGTSNPPAANSSATEQATPSTNSSDDTRVASNQAKHHKKQSGSTGAEGQMNSSQATPSQDAAGAAQAPAGPSPAPQQ